MNIACPLSTSHPYFQTLVCLQQKRVTVSILSLCYHSPLLPLDTQLDSSLTNKLYIFVISISTDGHQKSINLSGLRTWFECKEILSLDKYNNNNNDIHVAPMPTIIFATTITIIVIMVKKKQLISYLGYFGLYPHSIRSISSLLITHVIIMITVQYVQGFHPMHV